MMVIKCCHEAQLVFVNKKNRLIPRVAWTIRSQSLLGFVCFFDKLNRERKNLSEEAVQ